MTPINNINNQEYQTYLIDMLLGGARFFAIHDAHGIVWDISEELNIELTYVRRVPCKDLVGMVQNASREGISTNEIRGFVRADLVIEATHAEGDTHYIAVEASITGTQRDTSRAQSNAKLLARFTGRPAYAVVSSVRNDLDAEAEIAAGNVWWHEQEERDLEVE